MRNNYFWLISAGILSGLINALLLNQALFISAGIGYGLVTGMYFIYAASRNRKIVRLVFWIVASAISYFVAIQATLVSAPKAGWSVPAPDAINFALGGLIGALVLSLAFHFIFHKMTIVRHVMVTLGGALTAWLVIVVMSTYDSTQTLLTPNTEFGELFAGFMPILYIVWQTVITVALGSSIIARTKSLSGTNNFTNNQL